MTLLVGGRYEKEDFAGNDFRGQPLAGMVFHQCNFDGCNFTDVDCTGTDFSGSSFRKAICTRTNFRNAKLANTVFEPADCYGMTLTMDCKTFENMRVSQLWWYGWLLFGTMMIPAVGPVPGNLRDVLIGAIGAERFVKLRDLFTRREY
jgi:hypothetical protein